MSNPNQPIEISLDSSKSSSSNNTWENYIPPRKTSLSLKRTNPASIGPSSIQPMPQQAIMKGSSSDLSSMPSYVSPYKDTDYESSSRALVVPHLAEIPPPEPLPAPPVQALLPQPAGTSSSSPPIRERVGGLACPKVWDVIGGQGVQKRMPAWAIAKKP